MLNIHIAGAGFSGAVIGRQLAEAGHKVSIFDPRPHIAGNCHTQRDPETNVLMHYYGAHIFHTDSERVWNYIQRFGTFRPFVNRVKAVVKGKVYTLPFNLHTLNQFFGKAMSPKEARAFVAEQAKAAGVSDEPANMEEQAIALIGTDLYEAFVKGYTLKQWGMPPTELPAAIIKRLPVRYNYDDNYFSHPYQGMPESGYTAIVEKILDHPNIQVTLGTSISASAVEDCDHLFWTGPLDAFFEFRLGRLGYRTIEFKHIRTDGDYQGNAVINHPDLETPFTRIIEHKHFMPWEPQEKTIASEEYSRECGPEDTPYYPIRQVNEKAMLADYVNLANDTKKVTFVGRLGTYRYLDMDVTIREALETADRFLADPQAMPVFQVNPL